MIIKGNGASTLLLLYTTRRLGEAAPSWVGSERRGVTEKRCAWGGGGGVKAEGILLFIYICAEQRAFGTNSYRTIWPGKREEIKSLPTTNT